MVVIYKIFDSKDSGYTAWYGDEDDIIEYLKEQNQLKPNESWVKSLERYGLTFKVVYDKQL